MGIEPLVSPLSEQSPGLGASLRWGTAATNVPLCARMDPVLLPAFLAAAVARAHHGWGQAGLGLQGHIRHWGHRALPARGVSWHPGMVPVEWGWELPDETISGWCVLSPLDPL